METGTKLTILDLANKFVNCKMNCNIEHNPTRILRLIGPKHNDIVSLRNHFIEEKERLDKVGVYEFERYYDKDIVNIIDELIEDCEKRTEPNKVNALVGGFIVTALKEGSMFRKFKWNNYEKLAAADLFTLFPEFDTNFRGDIIAYHKVGGKYVVIESEQYPFDYDKQRYKTKEPAEKKFYSTEIRKNGKIYSTNTVFNTFEEALFHTMCPNQYSAMSILFNSQKD